MISFKKQYNGKGYNLILEIDNHSYIEIYRSEGDETFRLASKSFLEQIKEQKIHKKYNAPIWEILYSKDYEIPDLIIELEKEMMEDK